MSMMQLTQIEMNPSAHIFTLNIFRSSKRSSGEL